MKTSKVTWVVAVVGLASLVLAACGSDDTTSSATTTSVDQTSEGLLISDAWARSTPEGAERSAVYLTVESDEDDEIVGVSVPADVAAEAQLHETVIEEDAMDNGESTGHDDMAHGNGATSMREVDIVPIAAGTTVLEPGGYHIMLMGLAAPLTEGDSFELTVDFENAGSRTVPISARSG